MRIFNSIFILARVLFLLKFCVVFVICFCFAFVFSWASLRCLFSKILPLNSTELLLWVFFKLLQFFDEN